MKHVDNLQNDDNEYDSEDDDLCTYVRPKKIKDIYSYQSKDNLSFFGVNHPSNHINIDIDLWF